MRKKLREKIGKMRDIKENEGKIFMSCPPRSERLATALHGLILITQPNNCL